MQQNNASSSDESKYSWENLDNLSELEIKEFQRRYKEKHLPKSRLYALIPYNVIIGGACIYYTIHFKYYSQKFFQPKRFGIKQLFYYGTLQSIFFVGGYTLGTCLVTGLWNPIQYVRDIAQIQGQIIDNSIKFDDAAQEYFLFNFMNYFGLSKDVLEKAKSQLESQKQILQDKQYFSQETLQVINQGKRMEQKALNKNKNDDDDDDDD